MRQDRQTDRQRQRSETERQSELQYRITPLHIQPARGVDSLESLSLLTAQLSSSQQPWVLISRLWSRETAPPSPGLATRWSATTSSPWPTGPRWTAPETEDNHFPSTSAAERWVDRVRGERWSNNGFVLSGHRWLGRRCGQDVEGPESQADHQPWHGLRRPGSSRHHSSQLYSRLWCGATRLQIKKISRNWDRKEYFLYQK